MFSTYPIIVMYTGDGAKACGSSIASMHKADFTLHMCSASLGSRKQESMTIQDVLQEALAS